MHDASPVGTWYLRVRYVCAFSSSLLPVTVRLVGDAVPGTYTGMFLSENGIQNELDMIDWNPETRLLTFRRRSNDFWEWYTGTARAGVVTGRFSHHTSSPERPEQRLDYSHHFTGWNSDILDQDIVPRVYDVTLNHNKRSVIRLDCSMDVGFVGRLKVYAIAQKNTWSAQGEEAEKDLTITHWDGERLAFTRSCPDGEEYFVGTVNGRNIAGTYTRSSTTGSFPWHGSRAQVLGYGLTEKSRQKRAQWQQRTREQLVHLMMTDNPSPQSVQIRVEQTGVQPTSYEVERDDNPSSWPQQYLLTELSITAHIPMVYQLQETMVRKSHTWLAVPTTPPPMGKVYPVVLSLNGHRGSAWKLFHPGPEPQDIYWYGDAFARRGYVVLAVDISHRNDSLLYTDRGEGDDPAHGNAAHPSLKDTGDSSSDWEEGGERAWDVIHALDLLLEGRFGVQVDPSAIIVTGLSTGGEIATFVGALDPRIGLVISAGFSPDLFVMKHHGNHPCWQWTYTDITEYIDISDLHALIAPRPLIVETGTDDTVFSSFTPPFTADMEVMQRSRIAYAEDEANIVHCFHPGGHVYYVGDTPAIQSNSHWQEGASIGKPTETDASLWPQDGPAVTTKTTLFTCIRDLLSTLS